MVRVESRACSVHFPGAIDPVPREAGLRKRRSETNAARLHVTMREPIALERLRVMDFSIV
jgi:hypothetical protein